MGVGRRGGGADGCSVMGSTCHETKFKCIARIKDFLEMTSFRNDVTL